MKTIGLIGGGVMGLGIARHFLTRGFEVFLVESHQRLALEAEKKITEALARATARRPSPQMGRLRVGADLASLAEAEVVIEAIFEDLDLKRRVLAAAEKKLKPEAVLATNTSALSITALAAALSRPERFLGAHFFNPAQVMPLVEVVPGLDTSAAVVSWMLDFLAEAGKKPIQVKECPGFLVNRILGAYMNEALFLVEGAAGILDLEAAASELELPMGPAALGDMAGWDVIHAANTTLAESYGQRFNVPPLLNKLKSLGRFGLKTGLGLFDHSFQPPRPSEDLVPASRDLDASGLRSVKDRLLLAILAESIRCLDEGVAAAPDVDEAMRLGAGLKQGPLAWADEIGLDEVLARLEDLQGRFGPRFWPSPLLKTYVSAGYVGLAAGRGLAGRGQGRGPGRSPRRPEASREDV